MALAEHKITFARVHGRMFVELDGLKVWLWKQVDKANREGDEVAADVLRGVVLRIEEDSP